MQVPVAASIKREKKPLFSFYRCHYRSYSPTCKHEVKGTYEQSLTVLYCSYHFSSSSMQSCSSVITKIQKFSFDFLRDVCFQIMLFFETTLATKYYIPTTYLQFKTVNTNPKPQKISNIFFNLIFTLDISHILDICLKKVSKVIKHICKS